MVIRKISKKDSKMNEIVNGKANNTIKGITNGKIALKDKNKTTAKKISIRDITKEREAREKLEKEKQLKKEAEEKKEKDRQEKIVADYLDSLHTQLEDKNLFVFWVFPDRSGFTKIKISTMDEFEKLATRDVNKYKNRWVVNILISDLHKMTHPWSNKVSHGVMLMLVMNAHRLDENAKVSSQWKDRLGCTISWNVDDFKITKLSFKLIERLMHAMLETRKRCSFLTGFPLKNLLNNFKKEGYDFSDVLYPLDGL